MNKSIIKGFIKNIFKNKEQRHKFIIAATSWIPDKVYLKILYLFICKKRLSFNNPETFNEKIQWYKLYYKDPLMTKCADKYSVRNFIEEQGYGEYLVPLINTYSNAAEIDFQKLPDKCILKTTHNSSGSFKWNAERNNDIDAITKTFNDMLAINAFWLSREWAYKDITPRIVCEKWIEAEKIVDVKFLCFNGKAEYIYYDVGMNDEFGNHSIGHRAVLNRQFENLNIKTSMKLLSGDKIVIFKQMEKMREIADNLSKFFPHVRVDFFVADEKVYFSELTFYSGGGYGSFEPREWDEIIGKSFEINKIPKDENYVNL